jgi:hypothetical protein
LESRINPVYHSVRRQDAQGLIAAPFTQNAVHPRVGRSMRELTSRTLASGSVYYGVDGLNSACLGKAYDNTTDVTNAYLHREIWTRTYTEKNVRVYHITANKAFR